MPTAPGHDGGGGAEGGIGGVDPEGMPLGGKIVVERMGDPLGSLEEATLLSEASLREMIIAVRHRFDIWKRDNPLKVALIALSTSLPRSK